MIISKHQVVFTLFAFVTIKAVTCIYAENPRDNTLNSEVAPRPPEDALKQIEVDSAYELQIVAAEPLIFEPTECVWSANGELYVADMLDYASLTTNSGSKRHSRVQKLIDIDSDGRMDKAVTFADQLNGVQGLIPYKGGLVVTTQNQVLFLNDSDGDGIADQRNQIFGVNPGTSVFQVTSPRLGLDNCIYFNNNEAESELLFYRGTHPPGRFWGGNFKWNPILNSTHPTGGIGGYGRAFDVWGREFFCSDNQSIMSVVLPYEVARHTANSKKIDNWEEFINYDQLDDSGPDAKVSKHSVVETPAVCAGIGFYKGNLMPELKHHIFITDPVAHLITHHKIEQSGPSLSAGGMQVIVRSSHHCFRPVNVTTGPDGGLYISDIYRNSLGAPLTTQAPKAEEDDMHGRIWRLVPKGAKLRYSNSAPNDLQELVIWLSSENGWERETAQRLLVESLESNAEKVVPMLEANIPDGVGLLNWIAVVSAIEQSRYPKFANFLINNPETIAKIQRILSHNHTLRSFVPLKYRSLVERVPLKADSRELSERDAYIELLDATSFEALLGSVKKFPDSSWMLRAAICKSLDGSISLSHISLDSPSSTRVGRFESCVTSLLTHYITDKKIINSYSSTKYDFVATCAEISLSRNANIEDCLQILNLITDKEKAFVWWKVAFVEGFSEALNSNSFKLPVKNLSEFLSNHPQEFNGVAKEISYLLTAGQTFLTERNPIEEKLPYLPLLQFMDMNEARSISKEILLSGDHEATKSVFHLFTILPEAHSFAIIDEVITLLPPQLKTDLILYLLSNDSGAAHISRQIASKFYPLDIFDLKKLKKISRLNNKLGVRARVLLNSNFDKMESAH